MRNTTEVTLREAIGSGRLRVASELPDDARTPPDRYVTLGNRRVCRGDETHAIRDADRSGQRGGRPEPVSESDVLIRCRENPNRHVEKSSMTGIL